MDIDETAAGPAWRARWEAWCHAEEAAEFGAGMLRAQRERVRLARRRSAERRERAGDALAAGQEAFVQAFLDAAEAHDATAREAEATAAELEGRCRELRRAADAHQDVLWLWMDRQRGPARPADRPDRRRNATPADAALAARASARVLGGGAGAVPVTKEVA